MSELKHWQDALQQLPPRQLPADIRAALLHNRGSWRSATWLAVVLCALGFLVFFPWELQSTLKLDLNAKLARGQVVNSVFLKAAAGANLLKRRQRIYSVEFVYEDAFGYPHTGRCLSVLSLSSGAQVDVEYAADKPELARISGGFFVPGSYWAGLWAMLFPALAVFGIWNYQRVVRRRQRLLTHGHLTPAIIQQLWTDGSPDNDNGWIAIQFDADGAEVQLTESVSGAALSAARDIVRTRGTLTVLHSAEAPRECILLNLLPGAHSIV